ncbi:MAG: hypothetical protein QM744_09560 [Mesorhizobium sp.]
MLANTLDLIRGGQARVERLHHGVTQLELGERLFALANFTFTGQEHQYVATRSSELMFPTALATASGKSTSSAGGS